MDTLKQFATRTRVEGLVILLVALGYLWEGSNVPEFYQIPGIPGPTTFPYLLGTVFVLCGLWMLVSPKDILDLMAGKTKAGVEATAAKTEKPAGPAGWLRRVAGDWHFYAMWVVVLGYLWFMPDLGFPLSTFVLLAVFTYLLGETRLHIVLALALVTTAIIYVGFKMGLNVRLPLGVLETWFK